MLLQRANVYRLEPTEDQAGHFAVSPGSTQPAE
jgi:hypothetical protein